MMNASSLPPWVVVLSVFQFGLACSGSPPTPVPEKVTFHDIASRDSAHRYGLGYQRQPSHTEALAEALRRQPVTVAEAFDGPDMSRGIPGVAIFDYDRDGDLDIYVTNGPGAANSLFSNQLRENGTLQFVDVAVQAGVGAEEHDSSGVCFGDIDNDGDSDLVVLSNHGPNRLFENQGTGTFADISIRSGVGTGESSSVSCTLGDIDNDGLLDLLIGNAFDMSSSRALLAEYFALNEPNQLWRNTGDNVFEDVSETSGILDIALPSTAPSGAASITWAVGMVDLDLDGDLDILHADDQAALPGRLDGGTDRGLIQIFDNDGRGSFTNTTSLRGMSVADWMGLGFGDFNRDGYLDFFATNFGNHSVVAMTGRSFLEEQDSRWFLQNPDGTFADASARGSLNTPFGWGVSTADYDSDGDTDIIYQGGMDVIVLVIAAPAVVLSNDGAGHFERDLDALARSTDHLRRAVGGVAVGDLDGNGFVDIVSVSNFDIAESVELTQAARLGGEYEQGAAYLRPFHGHGTGRLEWAGAEYFNGTLAVELSSGNRNAWLQVEVLGTAGLTTRGRVNRDGIGAVVRCQPEGMPAVLLPVLGGASFASQDSLIQTCGLGRARSATIEVLWPGGMRHRIEDVAAGQRLLVPEIPCGARGPRPDPAACVERTLDELQDNDVLSRKQRARLRSIAISNAED